MLLLRMQQASIIALTELRILLGCWFSLWLLILKFLEDCFILRMTRQE